MKINPINNQNIIKAYGKNQVSRTEKKADMGLDEVNLSPEALSFSKVLSEVREAESRIPSLERQEKLDKIAEKIRTGEYKVDSESVAEKIISDVLSRYKNGL